MINDENHNKSGYIVLAYKGIPMHEVPYEMAIEALENVPIRSKHWQRMVNIFVEQHKNITFAVVEEIISKRISR